MAQDVTPNEVRVRGFELARRGYDRDEVDAYLGSLADTIQTLTGKLEDRTAKELKVGLDDPEALALELGAIGGEVASILEAARNAADGMRSRATSDVDQWRTTAESETRTLLSEAVEQSQSMRSSAWNEGSSMLSSSLAEAGSLVESAREDALFIRAEAERGAIRLTGDAKRDREESIRSARIEAEQLLDGARSESDGILLSANKQAEQAQQRARALEDRRSELLSDLESTRASIGQLEEQIESRRQELDTPTRPPESGTDARSHHASDSGSVRIVSPSRALPLKPVDAEELVAEVVALRTGRTIEPQDPLPSIDDRTDPEEVVEPETVATIAPPVSVDEPPVVSQEPAAQPEAPTVVEAEVAEVEPEIEPEADDDDIGSLFASLRDDTAVPSPSEVATLAPPREPPRPQPDEERVAEQPAAIPDPSDGEGVEELVSDEASTLIPLQNTALKEIKRSLVDLQNDALEHLRTDAEWLPKQAFTNKFKAPFGSLAAAITGAKNDGGAAKEFGAELHTAVTGALDTARESGAGDREVASSVSRIFRMWRADEAERRVVDAAQALTHRQR